MIDWLKCFIPTQTLESYHPLDQAVLYTLVTLDLQIYQRLIKGFHSLLVQEIADGVHHIGNLFIGRQLIFLSLGMVVAVDASLGQLCTLFIRVENIVLRRNVLGEMEFVVAEIRVSV